MRTSTILSSESRKIHILDFWQHQSVYCQKSLKKVRTAIFMLPTFISLFRCRLSDDNTALSLTLDGRGAESTRLRQRASEENYVETFF